MQRRAIVGVVVATCLASVVVAETRKEYRYAVGSNANVSVATQFGAISVRPGSSGVVVAVVTLKSDRAEVENYQKGNRIEIHSNLLAGADQQSGRVDCELIVPPDATVNLRTSDGPMSVDHVQGDLTFEAVTGSIDVRNANRGNHIHVHTMSGPVTLTEVHDRHIEITSISGDVHLNAVTGPLVQVNSGSGKIFYNGDFGSGGDYRFNSSSGDIEAIVPADASAEVTARSVLGKVQNDFPLTPSDAKRSEWKAGSSFMGTAGKAASEVMLRSFSGKIRLKQR